MENAPSIYSFGENELTKQQKELYDWLLEYTQKTGHSPTIRQMMEAMNLRSPAPVQSRLKHLEEKGWVEKKERNGRPGVWPTTPKMGIYIFVKAESLNLATLAAPSQVSIQDWINELIQFAAKKMIQAKEASNA